MVAIPARAFLKFVAFCVLCFSSGYIAGYLQDLPLPIGDEKLKVKNTTVAGEPPASSSSLTSNNASSKAITGEIRTETVDPAIATAIHVYPNPDNQHVYYLPSETTVDKVPKMRVMAAFPEGQDEGRDIVFGASQDDGGVKCEVTSKVVIHRPDLVASLSSQSTWNLITLDEKNNAKKVGGDEYYITYTTNDSNEPTAIANITDWKNGTYSFYFVTSPTMNFENTTTTTHARGTLTVILEQSCGIGSLSPHLKQTWLTSGAINQFYVVHNIPRPEFIEPFLRPNQNGAIDFGSLDQIAFTGDSLVGQLACPETNLPNPVRCATFRPNIYRGPTIESSLNTKTLETFLMQARREIFEAKQIARGKYEEARQRRTEKPRLGLVVGSGVWDLLSDETSDGGADFEDHLIACRQLILKLREEYPLVSIFWKSMTATHNHAVATTTNWVYIRRVYYMSNSRAARLYQLQTALMKELGVAVLDIFDATYFAAHKTRPGDGRHYQVEFNKLVLGWFYATPK